MAVLTVRVKPRAKREEVTVDPVGRIIVAVTAPPVEGKANEACRRALARALKVAPSQVRLIRGHKARTKEFEVTGIEDEELQRFLRATARPGPRP